MSACESEPERERERNKTKTEEGCHVVKINRERVKTMKK